MRKHATGDGLIHVKLAKEPDQRIDPSLRCAVCNHEEDADADCDDRHLDRQRMRGRPWPVMLQPIGERWSNTKCVRAAGAACSRKKRQNKQAHHVVDNSSAKDDRRFRRGHFAGIHQRAGGNGDAGGGKRAAEKTGAAPRQPKHMGRARAQKEWPDHAKKRHQKSCGACFTHTIDVGFEPGDEHEHESADLRHQQKCISSGRALK